jgi:hypothetical protein
VENRERGMRNAEVGMGNAEWGSRNAEMGMGNGEVGMRNGEVGMGKWECGNGEFGMKRFGTFVETYALRPVCRAIGTLLRDDDWRLALCPMH